MWCHGAIPVGVKKSDFKVSSISDNLNPQTADPGIPLVSTKVANMDSSPFIEKIEETEVRRLEKNVSSVSGNNRHLGESSDFFPKAEKLYDSYI